MTTTFVELCDTVLNKVWNQWNVDHSDTQRPHCYETRYATVNRNYGTAKDFEMWLYAQGALVVQRNKKRYLRFYSGEQATYFAMRYA